MFGGAEREAWPKGSRVTMQHDGAKAHTEGTVEGTIEDSSFTGDGKDDVRVDVLQQPSNSPDCNIWDIGAGSLCGTLEGLLEAIEFGDNC